MQPAPTISPAIHLPHLEEVSTLLRDHLQGDWIVRIEHRAPAALPRSLWRTWGRTQYTRQGADRVMDRILDCHAANPEHAIRLCAEKLRPQARLVYWVHPGETAGEADS
ncbi:MAG: hypothetical protein CMN57_06460 [Gammaproteobacteria bacterium]|nr:hypothetical protein [Gammaproteobacteria bacterium]